MPRIPPDEHMQLFSEEAAGSSTMATLFRIMNHRPEIMRHARELVEATMRGGTVDLKLKELLAIRVSQVNHCSY